LAMVKVPTRKPSGKFALDEHEESPPKRKIDKAHSLENNKSAT